MIASGFGKQQMAGLCIKHAQCQKNNLPGKYSSRYYLELKQHNQLQEYQQGIE